MTFLMSNKIKYRKSQQNYFYNSIFFGNCSFFGLSKVLDSFLHLDTNLICTRQEDTGGNNLSKTGDLFNFLHNRDLESATPDEKSFFAPSLKNIKTKFRYDAES